MWKYVCILCVIVNWSNFVFFFFFFSKNMEAMYVLKSAFDVVV
jgi:hypothetical protein